MARQRYSVELTDPTQHLRLADSRSLVYLCSILAHVQTLHYSLHMQIYICIYADAEFKYILQCSKHKLSQMNLAEVQKYSPFFVLSLPFTNPLTELKAAA